MSASPSTSASLLQRARKMDPAAWERLCRLYGPVVYGWCRRGGLQESDAADATQEVFRAVWTGISTFQGGRAGSFRRWLRVIALNAVRSHFRLAGRRPAALGGSDALRVIAGQPVPDSPDEGHDAEADRIKTLRRALDMIRGDVSEKTWSIFERTALRRQADRDVAAELGVTENAIRQARFRVLSRLREEFGELL